MRASHPSPICTAVVLTGLPIRFQIAPVASSRRSRRDGGCRHLPGVLRLPQFRSVALAGADLIAGRAIAVAMAVGARVQRVFAVIKGVAEAALHEPNVDRGAERDAPQFEAPGA